VGDLVQQTENDLLKIKNFGRKSLKEVKEVVEDLGFELGTEVDNWPPEELEDRAAESGT
jgi:DNA-directed RNA polymerase subunit alpha